MKMCINWAVVIPVGCIITAVGLMYGKEAAAMGLLLAGVVFLVGWWLED